jgi:hypothetical protein
MRRYIMAARERVELSVERRSSGALVERIRATVDAENEGELLDVLHDYLRSNGYDPAMWGDFVIAFGSGFGRREVQG